MSKEIAFMSFMAGRVGSEAAQHVLADRGLANNGKLGDQMDPLINLAFNPRLHRSVWGRMIREPFEIHLVLALSTMHYLDDEQIKMLLEDNRRMVKQGLFHSGMGFISEELGQKVISSGVVTPSLAHQWLGGMTNEAWIPERLIVPVSLIESGERMVKNILAYPKLFSDELVIERITGEFGKSLKHYQKADLLVSRPGLIPQVAELGVRDLDTSLVAAVAEALLLSTSKSDPVLTEDGYFKIIKYIGEAIDGAPGKVELGLACSTASNLYINPNLPKVAATLATGLHSSIEAWEWASMREGDNDWHLKAKTKLMVLEPKKKGPLDFKSGQKMVRLDKVWIESKSLERVGIDQLAKQVEAPLDRYGAAGWELLFLMAEGWESSFGGLLTTVLATLQR